MTFVKGTLLALLLLVPAGAAAAGDTRAEGAAKIEGAAAGLAGDLNLQCQGFLTAVARAARTRRDVADALDANRALEVLEEALVKEAMAAAASEGFSARKLFARAKEKVRGTVPALRAQVDRFVGLVRDPAPADAETLRRQEVLCGALVARLSGGANE